MKELYGQGSIRDVLLGETLKNESTAIVRTSMTVTSEAGEILITLNTHLVREQGGWQVDVRETKAEMARAVWAGGMRQLGEALGESLHEFKVALERGVDQMREALREALEEIQQELK